MSLSQNHNPNAQQPNQAELVAELQLARQRIADLEAQELQQSMNAQLAQKNLEVTLLHRTSQAFISTLDLDQVLENVLEEARQLLDVTGCSVWLLEAASRELVCKQATPPQGDYLRGWRLPVGQGLAGWVVQHHQSLIVPDTRHDARHDKEVGQHIGQEIRSILSVPIVKACMDGQQKTQQTIGVLQVVDGEPNQFSDPSIRLLEALAANAAIAIDNAQLYQQAKKDADTKEILLHEVNHRVKNNLSAIIGLLYAERRHADMAEQGLFQAIMGDLIHRVQGLATVHHLLSESQWGPVSLDRLTQKLIDSALRAIPKPYKISVQVQPSSIEIAAKQANSLAIIINELITNSLKHGFKHQDSLQISVGIDPAGDAISYNYQDNGPGYPPEALRMKVHNVGLYLIKTLTNNELGGELQLSNTPGATTKITFQVEGG